MAIALALDVGGTHLKYGLVDRAGKVVLARQSRSETGEGRAGVRRALEAALEDLLAEASRRRLRPVAVGLGFPGTVGGKSGAILTAPPQIPGVDGLRLQPLLERAAGLPAAVENDADAAGFAEASVGAGRGRSTVLTITVGTGIGGGLVMDGRLVRGRFGTGGEIGQTVFRPDRLPTPLGGPGRLEYDASAGALVRAYRRAGGARGAKPRAIVESARGGDPRAIAALARTGRSLGIGLANAAMVLAPDAIVIGGGLSAAGRLLLDPVRAGFLEAAMPYTAKGCRIVKARLGNRAGTVGAGLLAFARIASQG